MHLLMHACLVPESSDAALYDISAFSLSIRSYMYACLANLLPYRTLSLLPHYRPLAGLGALPPSHTH